jgi:excisionase family DNA binding protein
MEFDPTTPPPYSVKSLAERWECSGAMIRKLIKTGQSRHFTIGYLIRIPQAAVDEYEAGASTLAETIDYVAAADGSLSETDNQPLSVAHRIGRKPQARKPIQR